MGNDVWLRGCKLIDGVARWTLTTTEQVYELGAIVHRHPHKATSLSGNSHYHNGQNKQWSHIARWPSIVDVGWMR